jgi:V/A-type H+-transporting ATPase subunit C
MTGFAYASALGRLKPQFPAFLPKEFYSTLTGAKDLNEITKLLEGTAYGPEIARAASQYKGAPLLEVAINRAFVHRNRTAYESAPFAGRGVVGAYLKRWDTQNIGLILSSKALGRSVTEAELFLVSSREIPAGLFAGAMTIDDFRLLLQQPTLDAVAQNLVRFGYGSVLLPLMEAYGRTHDIFPLLLALDRDYYARLLETSRFYQGDEWTVRLFIQSEIDVRNALLVLKGKAGGLPVDVVQERFLPGGTLPASAVPELYSARAVPELVQALEPRFPTLSEGNPLYAADHSLTGFEAELLRDRAVRELKRLKSYPLSLSVIFTYLLISELERTDLRRIIYGKVYNFDPNTVAGLLVVPRI